MTCEVGLSRSVRAFHIMPGLPGPEGQRHAHDYRIDVVVDREQLDERGMVFDFGDIKKVVSRWIDDHLDHRMILNRADPAVPILEGLGEPMYLMDVNPTAENIAKLIFDVAAKQGFPVVDVRLWESPGCCAAYCAEFSSAKGTDVSDKTE